MKKTKISDWYGLKIDDERLFEYAKIPIEQKLQWLEETKEFLFSVEDQKIKDRWLAYREGRI